MRALNEMICRCENANESGHESYATEDCEVQRTRSHHPNSKSKDNEREEEMRSESEVKEERRDPRHTRHYGYEPYLKVPELLPEFNLEENNPKQFINDFNDVVKCIGERSNLKITFWFKVKVKIVRS